MSSAGASQRVTQADASFTCKLCKQVSPSFTHFLKHLKEECQFCKEKPVAKKKRGRPRLDKKGKHDRSFRSTFTPASLEASQQQQHVPARVNAAMKTETSSLVTLSGPGRATRTQTGAIKRKTAQELLADSLGDENEVILWGKPSSYTESAAGSDGNNGAVPKSTKQRRLERKLVKAAMSKFTESSAIEAPVLSDAVLDRVEEVKGDVGTVINEVNSILQGNGVVNYVAVAGSNQVMKVNDHVLELVQPDDERLKDSDSDRASDCYSDSDSELTPLHTAQRTGTETSSSERVEAASARALGDLDKLPYKCTRCTTSAFQTSDELDVHTACHNTRDTCEGFTCPEGCPVHMSSYRRVLQHLVTAHVTYRHTLQGTQSLDDIYGSFVCDICGQTFDLKHRFTNHMRRKHTDSAPKPFMYRQLRSKAECTFHCIVCSYATTTEEAILAHSYKHSSKSLSKFKGHGRTRKGHQSTPEQSHQCVLCEKEFGNKYQLEAHIKRHNPANQGLYQCAHCLTKCNTLDALKKHNRRFHEEVEKLKCPHCSYESKMQADMNKHITCVHERLHHCQVEGCNYCTNSIKQMEIHKEYHRPENVFHCPYDNCYFKTWSQQRKQEHLEEVHRVGSKHSCPICLKFFKKKTHLVRHIVSHTGEKVYKCGECEASFMSHSSYYRHRHKTGHDATRNGVVSVPQNIVIQYVELDEPQPASESSQQFSEEGNNSSDQCSGNTGRLHQYGPANPQVHNTERL